MAIGDVVEMEGLETKLPVSVEKVLRGALEDHLEKPFDRVIVIGVYDNEPNAYFASEADAGTNSWDAQRFIHELHVRADNALSAGN